MRLIGKDVLVVFIKSMLVSSFHQATTFFHEIFERPATMQYPLFYDYLYRKGRVIAAISISILDSWRPPSTPQQK